MGSIALMFATRSVRRDHVGSRPHREGSRPPAPGRLSRLSQPRCFWAHFASHPRCSWAHFPSANEASHEFAECKGWGDVVRLPSHARIDSLMSWVYYETPCCYWIETHDAARARGCWRSSHDGQLTVLYCVPTNPGPRSFRAWPVRRCHWRTS